MRISTTLSTIAVGALSCALGAGTASAAPARTTSTTPLTGVIDSCDGFEVVADLVARSTETTYTDGTSAVHVRLTGTVSNVVTDRAGRYAEIQVDKTRADGSGFSAGLLSKLVLPGHGVVPLYVGRVTFGADGTVWFTPHAVGVADEAAFHDGLCEALR